MRLRRGSSPTEARPREGPLQRQIGLADLVQGLHDLGEVVPHGQVATVGGDDGIHIAAENRQALERMVELKVLVTGRRRSRCARSDGVPVHLDSLGAQRVRIVDDIGEEPAVTLELFAQEPRNQGPCWWWLSPTGRGVQVQESTRQVADEAGRVVRPTEHPAHCREGPPDQLDRFWTIGPDVSLKDVDRRPAVSGVVHGRAVGEEPTGGQSRDGLAGLDDGRNGGARACHRADSGARVGRALGGGGRADGAQTPGAQTPGVSGHYGHCHAVLAEPSLHPNRAGT